MEVKKEKKFRGILSLETVILGIVVASILLMIGAYVVQLLANTLGTGASTNVNLTFGNVTSTFAQMAPLLVVVGIIGMIAIVLFVIRGGLQAGGGGYGGGQF